MKKFLIVTMAFVLTFGILQRGVVLAAMSSTNYQIDWDSISVGGNDTSSSASFNLRDSIGNPSGIGTSTSFQNESGYRAGVYDRTADYQIFVQSRSTQIAATNFSGTTVTVSNISGYTIGDMFVLIQDEGQSQIAAIAKITNIVGNVIYFDFLTHGGVAPSIDGVNDYVYKLIPNNSNSINFGILSSSVVTTGIIAWEVTADVDQGYSIYIFEDQDLQINSSTKISDVTDGTVSAGANEYGGRSSDTSLSGSTFDTADSAFTSSMQQIGSRGVTSFASRDFVTLKVAIPPSLSAGTYSQNLNVIYVGDY